MIYDLPLHTSLSLGIYKGACLCPRLIGEFRAGTRPAPTLGVKSEKLGVTARVKTGDRKGSPLHWE